MKHDRGPDQVEEDGLDDCERLPVPEAWNQMTHRIIGCAMEVHSVLGPGLVERWYEEALAHELSRAGLKVQRQMELNLQYKDIVLSGQRLDLVVESLVVVEVKSFAGVADAHLAQLVSYLRAGRFPLGLLINFNAGRLKRGIHRRLNEAVLPRGATSVA